MTKKERNKKYDQIMQVVLEQPLEFQKVFCWLNGYSDYKRSYVKEIFRVWKILSHTQEQIITNIVSKIVDYIENVFPPLEAEEIEKLFWLVKKEEEQEKNQPSHLCSVSDFSSFHPEIKTATLDPRSLVFALGEAGAMKYVRLAFQLAQKKRNNSLSFYQ